MSMCYVYMYIFCVYAFYSFSSQLLNRLGGNFAQKYNKVDRQRLLFILKKIRDPHGISENTKAARLLKLNYYHKSRCLVYISPRKVPLRLLCVSRFRHLKRAKINREFSLKQNVCSQCLHTVQAEQVGRRITFPWKNKL